MKKILFLLLATCAMRGQTYQNPTFGTVKTKTAPTVTTTPHLGTVETDGTISKITPENLPVSTSTTNALFSKKDATSTALTSTATLTNNGTTFTLSPLSGVIVDNSTVPATRTVINFAGASNVTPLYFRTLLYIDNTGTLQQMNGMTTDLTPQQRVDNLFIGIVVYSGGTVQVVQLIPDIEYSIDNRFSTLTDFLRNINEGNNIGANGANLQINKGAGYTFRRGSNFATNREVPDVTTDLAATPIPASPNLIGYRNGSGGWTYEPYTGSLTPQFWDNGTGVKATVANNKFTNQRVYFFNGTNTYVIYLGRTEHATLSAATTAAQNPDAIVDPATSVGSLIGTVSVEKSCTALNNTALAAFTQGPRMQGGSGAGGASGSQNLQNTYLNSSVPQITTTALGAVTVQEGTGTDSNNILVGKNNAGTNTFSVTGAGVATASNGTLIGGSGTVNTIPLFSTSTGLGNSFLTQNSEGMKIGSLRTTFGVGLSVSQYSTVMNRHIFDDYSLFNPTVGGSGFGAFDASTELMGTVDNAHFMAFQSRLKYTSSGNLTDSFGLTGLISLNTHEGSGDIAVANGVLIHDVGGVKGSNGDIGVNSGITIENMQRGLENWVINSKGGDSRFNGDIYNLNGKGFFSYSQGDKFSTDKKFTALVNDGKSVWYSIGQGAYTPSNFVMRTFDGTTLLDRFEIDASNGNIGIGTSPGSFKVDVLGGDNNGYKYRGSSGVEAILGVSPTTAQIGSFSNHPVQIVVNSTAVASYDAAGDFVVTGNITANNYSGGATLTAGSTVPTATAGDNSDNIATTAFVQSNKNKLIGYTVATLPTGTIGDLAYVTDASGFSYNSILVGGGSGVTLAFFDGTNWRAH